MSIFVVDASVGMKWFVPEFYSTDAVRLQDPACQLHVPTLFDVEMANILWKKSLRAELKRDEADDILNQFLQLPLTRHAVAPLLSSAFDLAAQTQRTVYDCLYLVLAIDLGGQMVTADQKLYNALSATAWNPHLCWVGNIP
jgi:predicted nucleic acid-binding protein